ncbi:MAG: phosphate ABC transporter substrate-binding protein [Calditrichaeota bacterium]|nr:MAG: phosphate ABC transporter substrate-binding protein [Calditrichota bacterium]
MMQTCQQMMKTLFPKKQQAFPGKPKSVSRIRFGRVLVWSLLLSAAFMPASAGYAGQKQPQKKPARSQLVVAGSVSCKTTFAAPLARQFAKKYDMKVKVYSGGSETGIFAVYARAADLAISSRPLTEDERKAGLQDTVIAYDAIAVIVHENNPVQNLTLKQLNKIFRHKIKSWKKLGWKDAPISVILPDTSSGLRKVFLQTIMRGKKIKVKIKEGLSTYGAIALLQKDSTGIAICSLSQAHYAHIKPIAVNGVTPNFDTLAEGSYPLQAPICLVTYGRPNLETRRFVAWITRGPAEKLLAKSFLVPREQGAYFSE